MVMDYVSQFEPSHVSIFGCDFKKTRTFYNKYPVADTHDFEKERLMCESLCEHRGWKIICNHPESQSND
ncbi:hypothetical protein A6302_04205 [Methylobrevis pamukkalensis]|uniref:Uncharacterized protein n=1 Tax=Methylobrevis pamukkalensis TaxID=1439726 RepID=A0A1E3GWU0_9HYPH|nr:hypothetical protein A6302_04205 [Methylobrevis pamukkalensis]